MALLNNLIVFNITIIHIIVIIFILITPFSNNNTLLLFYIIFVPFLLLHWLLNDDTCCLTLFEAYFRNKTSNEIITNNETFMNKIISPVYKFSNNNKSLEKISYIVLIGLLIKALLNLFYNYDNNKWIM